MSCSLCVDVKKRVQLLAHRVHGVERFAGRCGIGLFLDAGQFFLKGLDVLCVKGFRLLEFGELVLDFGRHVGKGGRGRLLHAGGEPVVRRGSNGDERDERDDGSRNRTTPRDRNWRRNGNGARPVFGAGNVLGEDESARVRRILHERETFRDRRRTGERAQRTHQNANRHHREHRQRDRRQRREERARGEKSARRHGRAKGKAPQRTSCKQVRPKRPHHGLCHLIRHF